MSASYPYIGDLASIPNIVEQFRKTFAKNIDAKVIRTCEFAKKHKNRIIRILKFINVIDENANKTWKLDKVILETIHKLNPDEVSNEREIKTKGS